MRYYIIIYLYIDLLIILLYKIFLLLKLLKNFINKYSQK